MISHNIKTAAGKPLCYTATHIRQQVSSYLFYLEWLKQEGMRKHMELSDFDERQVFRSS